MATLAATSVPSSPSRGPPALPSARRGNSARSKIAWVRNGTTTPSADDSTMATAMIATRPR